MNKEIIAIFRDTEQRWFIDCTLGMGGHTRHMLEHFPNARVLGIDMDHHSLEQAKSNLSQFGDRVEFSHLNYTGLFRQPDIPWPEVSGILVDPGVSIFQLKEKERGFSHSIDSPLDMRKDRRSDLTASHVINTYKEKELTEIFETYGEVRQARQLAKRIIENRLFGPIDTTGKLTAIIEKMYHWKPKRGRTHPAANVFQALRIIVNRELEGVEAFLEAMPQYLVKGARIVFLTFHSVEDRVVKQCFAKLQKNMKLKIIKPFPALPTETEVVENLPSRSAKLRAGEIL